jgi:hypothetical protein
MLLPAPDIAVEAPSPGRLGGVGASEYVEPLASRQPILGDTLKFSAAGRSEAEPFEESINISK